MPKANQFVKENRKKGKQKDQSPETADEFLAAGVEYEEAGEKWRAGDAAKSARFFVRAIDEYEKGLRAFPQSFDLAYNKARLQYQITQHPRLLAQHSTSSADLLRVALDSHRYALGLRPDDADVLFNTAQVLTSLAEVMSEGRRSSQTSRDNALRLLQEALELFQRCLTVQEFKFTESQEMMQMGDEDAAGAGDADDRGDGEMTSNSSEGTEDGQWASVLEPVTKDTLVDTAVAQLQTLTTTCGMLTSDPGSGLAWLEEYSNNLLRGKIATYVEGTDRQHEVDLARANFICALADASYRLGRIDLQTYERELTSAFGANLDLSQDPQGLCDRADALVTFTSTVVESVQSLAKQNRDELSIFRSLLWKQLSSASTSLTTASKLPTAQNLAKVNIARGDVELRRFRLGEPPLEHGVAKRSAATLLKNAQTYYRGAAALAKNDGSEDEEREAIVKLIVAETMAGDDSNQSGLQARDQKEIVVVVEEMVEDGIIGSEWLAKLGSPEPDV